MAENAQEDIRRQWLVQNHAHLWSEAYGEAVARAGAKKAGDASPMESALAAAALRLNELRDPTKSRYSRLHDDLEKQHAEILLRSEQIDALRSENLAKSGQLEDTQTVLREKDAQIEPCGMKRWGYANSAAGNLPARCARFENRLLARLLKK